MRVVPGARTTQVVGRLGEAWKIRVQAPPERGRANDEVVSLLAHALGVPRSEIRVVSGHTTRDKVVELDRISLEEADRRLAAIGKDVE